MTKQIFEESEELFEKMFLLRSQILDRTKGYLLISDIWKVKNSSLFRSITILIEYIRKEIDNPNFENFDFNVIDKELKYLYRIADETGLNTEDEKFVNEIRAINRNIKAHIQREIDLNSK